MSQSYMDADGYAPVDQDLITDGVTVQRVEPKTVWNPQTGRREQKTNRKGVPQWLVYVLFTPLPSDYVHIPQVVPVTVAADEQPEIQPGASIAFTDFGAWFYARADRDNPNKLRVFRSFMASGFTQAADEPEGF